MGENEYSGLWRKDWRSTAPIRYKTVKVTSAEILALNATPKELVSAPGAGRAIEFVSAALHLDYGTATYASNGTLTIRTATSNSVLSGTLPLAGCLGKTADGIGVMAPISAGVDLDSNEAIELFMPTGETGTGDGTLTIVVGYRIHSFLTY